MQPNPATRLPTAQVKYVRIIDWQRPRTIQIFQTIGVQITGDEVNSQWCSLIAFHLLAYPLFAHRNIVTGQNACASTGVLKKDKGGLLPCLRRWHVYSCLTEKRIGKARHPQKGFPSLPPSAASILPAAQVGFEPRVAQSHGVHRPSPELGVTDWPAGLHKRAVQVES